MSSRRSSVADASQSLLGPTSYSHPTPHSPTKHSATSSPATSPTSSQFPLVPPTFSSRRGRSRILLWTVTSLLLALIVLSLAGVRRRSVGLSSFDLEDGPAPNDYQRLEEASDSDGLLDRPVFEEEAVLDHLGVTVPHEVATHEFGEIPKLPTRPNANTEGLNHLPLEPTLVVTPPTTPSVPDPSEGPINISVLPKPRLPSTDSERYLGFLPHSGFHNQRSALQNAYLLGAMLNRTVLIPPIWLGWPTPTLAYDELQKTWTTQILMHLDAFGFPPLPVDDPLNLPGDYPSSDPRPLPPSIDPLQESPSEKHWKSLGYETALDGYPITNLTAADCKSYRPECRHTYKDSFLSWEFFVDLGKVQAQGVEVVDRWDLRERAVESLLGAREEDIFVLRDLDKYDFQFSDATARSSGTKPGDPDPMLRPATDKSHWKRVVSIPALSLLPHKVLLVGSLFGSGRIRATKPLSIANPSTGTTTYTPAELIEIFGQAMAFRNPLLLAPAIQISDRLGGPGGFVAIHARIGDGPFGKKATTNMAEIWRILAHRLGVKEEVIDGVWERISPVPRSSGGRELRRQTGKKGEGKWSRDDRRRSQARKRELAAESEQDVTMKGRSDWDFLDGDTVDEAFLIQEMEHLSYPSLPTTSPNSTRPHLHKRAPISSLHAPSLSHLTCRSPLHTQPALRLFNTPLYIATDSPDPVNDPHLAIFFASYPCVFVLSDFTDASEINDGFLVSGVGEMKRWVNERDGQKLARHLFPFLEAAIAAMGWQTVGTPGSTFSQFTSGWLHHSYALDPPSV